MFKGEVQFGYNEVLWKEMNGDKRLKKDVGGYIFKVLYIL